MTDSLKDEILQALENQEQIFLLDATCSRLVLKGQFNPDDDRFYELPEWNSKNGFELRSDFVNNLHSPQAQENLKNILHSGRGVFRNFKNELKNYPEIEKKWHSFKNQKMRSFIDEWYNGLREIWGLEKLGQVTDENDDLIHNDFVFKKFTPENLKLITGLANAESAFEGNWPQEIGEAAKELWLRQFSMYGQTEQIGYICSSLSNEFAGCILAAPVSKQTEKVMVLTCFFVLRKFRGLGIGTELLDMCLSELKSLNKKWILLTNTIVPEEIEPMLLRSGFEKTGSGYAAEIR